MGKGPMPPCHLPREGDMGGCGALPVVTQLVSSDETQASDIREKWAEDHACGSFPGVSPRQAPAPL